MSSAYLVIDIQNDYFPNGKFPLADIEQATVNAAKFLEFARKNGIKVIHIRHESPEDGPFFVVGSPGAQINEAVKPLNDEVVITKRHPNSFVDTNLQEVLQKEGIKKLYISGAMSNICVQGTARNASELGYEVVVLNDAIGSRDFEYGGTVVKANDVKATVFATLAFGYANLITTQEAIAGF